MSASARPGPPHPPSASTPPTRRVERASLPLLVLCGAVVVLGIVVRLVGLTRQGYWSDEQFTVNQASSSLGHLWAKGRTEIHPPLFAAVMWVWEHLGGTLKPHWMRLVPAVCGCASVAVAWWGLRRSRLSADQRLMCVAGIATSGMAIIYSQDVRSYSLLLLASVGATAASLVLAGGGPGRRTWWVWCGWCMLASATHLFGAILTVWLGAVLCLLLDRRGRTIGLTLLALVPQFAWLLHGALTPGFARGASWIPAPDAGDAWDLVTSVFGVGRLHMDPEGFTMRNPAVAACVLGLVALALVLHLVGRRNTRRLVVTESVRMRQSMDATGSSVGGAEAPDRSVPLLVLVSLGLPVVVFLGSQIEHLWTLRNMIIVLPAWVWSVCVLVGSVPGRSWVRRLLSLLLVLCFLVGAVGTTVAKHRHYKTDNARAMDALASIRADNPTLRLYTNGMSVPWLYASHLPATPAEFARLTTPLTRTAVNKIPSITPAPSGPTVYMFLTSWHMTSDTVNQRILKSAGPGCRAIPLTRIAMVVCHVR